ncbi:MAG: penicillin-binding protein 2, partial [Gammaproteobacteria bacterium]|nr:penicillin-binding protein 2 [Gammaproteobacteria bacterium]
MIKSPINIGDAQQERKLLLARILAAGGFVIFLSLVLVARLAWLQIYKHDHFTTLSRGNRLKVVAIPPPRGLILSRDGEVIAENRPAFSLVADPSEIKPDAPYIDELNELLGAGETDRERFADQY